MDAFKTLAVCVSIPPERVKSVPLGNQNLPSQPDIWTNAREVNGVSIFFYVVGIGRILNKVAGEPGDCELAPVDLKRAVLM